MDQEQARALGELLRQRRVELGLSLRDLQVESGVDYTTIVRFEQGAFGAPRPDKLTRLAGALKLPLADVFAAAEYIVPDELPTLNVYLRTKYGEMPPAALEELKRIVSEYGFEAAGPADGEDEAPEPQPAKPPRKKGGRHASSNH